MSFLRTVGVVLTLASIVCTGLIASKAEATSTPYSTYTVLNKPPKSDIVGNGINSSGQIVGTFNDKNFVQHGFVLTNGAFTRLNVPGSLPNSTVPAGINEFGVIVGNYLDSLYMPHGFVLNHGVYTTLDVNLSTAAANSTFVSGINDWGQVVGSYQDNSLNPRIHGFILTNGVYTSYDVHVANPAVNINSTQIAGINDLGQIVGQYTSDVNGDPLTVGTYGFIASGSIVTTLNAPGALNGTYGAGTQAYGINAQGQVVGSFVDVAGVTHGFLYSWGTYTVLNAPGAANTYANGINALGQIVGYYDDGTFSGTNLHTYVLNP